MIDHTDAGDVPAPGEPGGGEEVLHYLHDALGSVVALTDAAGAVVEQYTYDPYGPTYIEDPATGGRRDASAYGNPFAWTGQRYDAGVNLYHFLFRSYSPRLGRWLQRDPLGYIDGVSLYQYVGSRPTFFTDPLGLEPPNGPPWPPGQDPGEGGGDDGGDGGGGDGPKCAGGNGGNGGGDGPGGFPPPNLPPLGPENADKVKQELEDLRAFIAALEGMSGDPWFWLMYEWLLENLRAWEAAYQAWLDAYAMAGHTPGRGHQSKSGPPKKERFRKKAADKRKQKDDEYKEKWDRWNKLSDEAKKLRPELHPDWKPGQSKITYDQDLPFNLWVWSFIFDPGDLAAQSDLETTLYGTVGPAGGVLLGWAVGWYLIPAVAAESAAAAPLAPLAVPSDRNIKENLAPMDGKVTLDALVDLPITSWNYKAESATVRHIGPMAQDFHRAFGLGGDDRSITVVDAYGVALSAIQGLDQLVREKDAEIARLHARVEALEMAVERLSKQRETEK